MSHPRHDPRLDIADAPGDAAVDGFDGYRHLLSHAVVTVVLLVALTGMVAWLLLT